MLEVPGALAAARAERELLEARRKVAATAPLAQHKVGARLANLVRHQTGADPGACVDTTDPFDRAHDRRGPDGLLLPAAVSDGGKRAGKVMFMLPEEIAKPRRYPRCYIVGGDASGVGGVSFESCYDRTREAQERLAGIPGVGMGDETPAQARTRLVAQMQAEIGPERTRARLRQRTRQGGKAGGKA